MSGYKKERWIRTTRGATPHNICFDCRVSFKDISVCPHCHQPLINAGTRFKPPRRNNLRDWKRLYLIHLAGHTYSCWAMALTPRDAQEQLEQARKNNPIDAMSRDLRPSRKPAPYKKPKT